MKACTKCHTQKPLDQFYKRVAAPDGLQAQCKACSNAISKAWKRAHPEYDQARHHRQRQEEPERIRVMKSAWNKASGYTRRSNLRKNYGLTVEAYESMLEGQGGVCAICKTDTPGGRGSFHVDHDHGTGRIRGLLCHHCNLGLGNFKDSPASLASAITYLVRS